LCLCGSIDLLVFQFGQIFNASHISKHPGINPQNSLQGLQFTSKGLTSGFIVESTFALVQDYNSDFGKFDAVPPIIFDYFPRYREQRMNTIKGSLFVAVLLRKWLGCDTGQQFYVQLPRGGFSFVLWFPFQVVLNM